MSNQPSHGAEDRAKWRSYFAKVAGESPVEIEIATDAAMTAIDRHEDQAGILAAGKAAVTQYRASAGRPAVSPTPIQPQQTSPYEPATPRPTSTAESLAVGDARSGMVTGLQQRQEMFGRTYYQVWNFRIERRNADGSKVPPVPVEIRARRIHGQLANGDMVEFPAKSRPMRVRNLTTASLVTAKGKQRVALYRSVWICTVLLFLSGFVYVAINIALDH